MKRCFEVARVCVGLLSGPTAQNHIFMSNTEGKLHLYAEVMRDYIRVVSQVGKKCNYNVDCNFYTTLTNSKQAIYHLEITCAFFS